MSSPWLLLDRIGTAYRCYHSNESLTTTTTAPRPGKITPSKPTSTPRPVVTSTPTKPPTTLSPKLCREIQDRVNSGWKGISATKCRHRGCCYNATLTVGKCYGSAKLIPTRPTTTPRPGPIVTGPAITPTVGPSTTPSTRTTGKFGSMLVKLSLAGRYVPMYL